MIRVSLPLGLVLGEIEKCAAEKPLNDFAQRIRSRRSGRATYVVELWGDLNKPNGPRAEVMVQGDSCEGGTMVQVAPGSTGAADPQFLAEVEVVLWNCLRSCLARRPALA
jgi:hypothetical protein